MQVTCSKKIWLIYRMSVCGTIGQNIFIQNIMLQLKIINLVLPYFKTLCCMIIFVCLFSKM